MKTYELAVILRADREETEVKRDVEAVKALLEKTPQCSVVNMDPWNRRKLAYPIDDHFFGFYVVFDVNIEPATLKELRQALALNDRVLRFMFLRKD